MIYIERSLRTVNFFSTLPRQTIAQLSHLLDVQYLGRGEKVFHQGTPGDTMYILLTGHIQVWRSPKRKSFPAELVSEYKGVSTYPWFGEVLQWHPNNIRPGEAIAVEPSVALLLRRKDVDQFVLTAPGFKALCMSLASKLQSSAAKHAPAEVCAPSVPVLPVAYIVCMYSVCMYSVCMYSLYV